MDIPVEISKKREFWRITYDVKCDFALPEPSKYWDPFIPDPADFLSEEFCDWLDDMIQSSVVDDEEPWWCFDITYLEADSATWRHQKEITGYKFVFSDLAMALLMKLRWGGKCDW